MAFPVVVLSDLHLDGRTRATAAATARFVAQHPGYEIVLSGDVFGLSEDPPEVSPYLSVRSTLEAHPDLSLALLEHLSTGGKVTWIAGNHDAAATEPGLRDVVLRQLGAAHEVGFEIEPWFIRRGGVHIEHGHVWDADNAPVHPLGDWSLVTEPLGVALTRRFVSKHASHFAHAHETTLAQGLRRAFTLYGARAPLLIARYFGVAGAICVEALVKSRMAEERQQGLERRAALSERSGLDLQQLQQLIDALPDPTHTQFRSTFFRLYFDRVLLGLGSLGGAAWTLTRLSPLGLGFTVATAAALRHNVRRTGARYKNLPIQRLREGAAVVGALTHAKTVVFGHTHVPTVEEGYVNSGSFAYFDARLGRPYVHIDRDSNLELRRFAG